MTGTQAKDGSSADRRDMMFDGALNSVLQTDKRDYPCYVGGLKVASGNEYVVKSPIDQSIHFGRFQEPEPDLSARAVDVANAAFTSWSKTDPLTRAGIFETVLDTIKRQMYRIAASVTLSAGMTRNESLYEVERLIEVTEDGIQRIRSGVKGKPMGTFAIISEYNSPLAAPVGYAVSAMIAGNCVIVIPPKECPFPAYMLYDIFSKLLPDGVLNLIFDAGGRATSALADNEDIKGIVATGRGDRFEDLMFSAVNDDMVFISEFKGMNPLVVYRPSSMQAAADITIDSAFRYSGQRIDSCSKAIITTNEQKQFLDYLLASSKKMIIDDPAEKDTFTGPVISQENLDAFLKIVKENKDNLIFGGKRISNEITGSGYYVMPAIFFGLPEDHILNEMDHSLPILSVQLANDLDEAIEMANGCEFGLSSGILSKDEKVVERFLGEAGSDTVYVNGSSGAIGTALRADVTEFLRK